LTASKPTEALAGAPWGRFLTCAFKAQQRSRRRNCVQRICCTELNKATFPVAFFHLGALDIPAHREGK